MKERDGSVKWGRTAIPLIPGGEAGWCYYSEPIEHGFSDGLLWIDLAVEQPDGRLLFGAASPFEDSEYMEEPLQLEAGALMAQDQRSFRIGIRLLKDTEQKEAVIRWRIRRIPGDRADRVPAPGEKQLVNLYLSAKEQKDADNEIYIESTPRYLYRGQKFMFTCHLPEQDEGPVSWRVLGEDSGTIDKYGVYTAPERQGVFQVEAVVGDPVRARATVYVMVKES